MFKYLSKVWFNFRHRRYLKLKKIISKKNSSWIKLFDTLYFKSKTRLFYLQFLFGELKRERNLLHRLPKQLNQYQTFDEIENDFSFYILSYKESKRLIDSDEFPRSIKRILKADKNLLEKFIQLYNDNSVKRGLQELCLLKYHSECVDFLNAVGLEFPDILNDLYKEKLQLLEKVENCKIVLADEKKKRIVVKVNTYAAMKIVGSKAWCISTELDSWREYVSDKKKTQYIIWNLKYNDRHPNYMIGVTFNEKKKEISHAFDHYNDKVKTGKMYKYINRVYGTKIHN